MKKILICDDHVLFCNGLRQLLESAGKNYEVHTVHSSQECKKFFKAGNNVDVFICDLNIDNRDGFLLLEELKLYRKHVDKTIILSAYYEDFLIKKAEAMGINAFLRKEATSEELIFVIEQDFNSQFYPGVEKTVTHQNAFQQKDQDFVNRVKLSNQEKKIINLIVKGKTSKEIGEILFISKATVDTHRKNINRKLNITNIGSLIQFAHENNLCD